jgi:hypothetical protein
VGHDGDSTNHDEVDAAGRQRSQMALVIGLERPPGHWRVGLEAREASIAR